MTWALHSNPNFSMQGKTFLEGKTPCTCSSHWMFLRCFVLWLDGLICQLIDVRLVSLTSEFWRTWLVSKFPGPNMSSSMYIQSSDPTEPICSGSCMSKATAKVLSICIQIPFSLFCPGWGVESRDRSRPFCNAQQNTWYPHLGWFHTHSTHSEPVYFDLNTPKIGLALQGPLRSSRNSGGCACRIGGSTIYKDLLRSNSMGILPWWVLHMRTCISIYRSIQSIYSIKSIQWSI